MIISSVNGNNNGWVVTCGCATAVAALCVFAATAATRRDRIDVFEDADAERLEDRPIPRRGRRGRVRCP
jgi:hypothetical protein